MSIRQCIYVVGIGPGAGDQMTAKARKILEESHVIVGYTVYTDLVKREFPHKRYLSTPMKQEVERCHMALREAQDGQPVAMVCSGDAGVYGMAGLILELAKQYPSVKVQVIPGVTAALAGSALLGAPLSHDFAVISLSDLLTPMEEIEKRLRFAAMADFAICLYNPSSKKRGGYLSRACDILMEFRSPDTVCGLARNIGREEESCRLLSLEELKITQTDMFTTVFIGNSRTREMGGFMVTPRGYRDV